MAINDNITLSKGSFSVTIATTKPSENFKNTLIVVPPVQAPANQDQGPKASKVVDLLRITHSFVFGGHITATASKSAKEVKDDLIQILEGAGVSGGTPATLTYEDDTFSVYVEDLVILKVLNDNAVETYSGKDSIEYNVTIKLIVGEAV